MGSGRRVSALPVVGRWDAESLESHQLEPPGAEFQGARFQLLSVSDLEQLPDPSHLIDGVLPDGGNVMLYGPSGEGKSFLALDWALSIAGWQPSWMGRAVLAPGRVVYLAAEGLASMKLRVRSWMHANRVTDDPDIRFIGDAVQLLELTDARALLRAIEAASVEMPALIVLDTLARCMVGADENAVRDVSQAIASIDFLRQESGATVLLVHHSQKQGDLERGSSALRAAQDVMLSLRNDDGVLVLESTKVKDGPPVEKMFLMLQPVLESCVISSQDSAPVPAGLTRKQRDCLQALERVAIDGAATATIWLESSAIPKRTFYRLLKQLVDGGYIQKRKGVGYAWTPTGEAELVSGATKCQTGASVTGGAKCHEVPHPFRGGTDGGTGTSTEDQLERAAIQAEGSAA